MSLPASIALHIPYLRRFARALTGSQASGDAYAVAAVEALAEPGDDGVGRRGTRQALYRVFFTIWGSIPVNQQGVDEAGPTVMRAADRTLEALAPLPRAAFLLRALESFTTAEIAAIVGRTQTDVQALLEEAGRQIAAHLCADVLIIEDEPIIAMDLEALVTDLGHSVLQIVRTRAEAATAVRRHRPGLVLADIQLADGSSGLEAVNDILAECEVPVVFITAYPERLLTGERPEPTFLITKPFVSEAVKAVVSQALFFDRRASLVLEAANSMAAPVRC